MAPTLGGAAVWYAERGHLVFPLKPGTKVPATRRGFHDASMNPDTIRNWWRATPAANIGLSTGHLFQVIDVDGPDGIRSIADIEDAGHLPEPIGYVKTPRGCHIYTKPLGDGCATAIRPGIDLRGNGGYVVAPPSIVEGITYAWITPLLVEDI